MIDYDPKHNMYMATRDDGASLILTVLQHDRVIDPIAFQPIIRLQVQWIGTEYRGVLTIPMFTFNAPLPSGELHMGKGTCTIVRMTQLYKQIQPPKTIKLNSRITDL